MSAAILRHPAYVEWPADPRDRLPLTLWDARSIAEAVGGTASHDFQVAGVEMDSRDVVNGDLFMFAPMRGVRRGVARVGRLGLGQRGLVPLG